MLGLVSWRYFSHFQWWKSANHLTTSLIRNCFKQCFSKSTIHFIYWTFYWVLFFFHFMTFVQLWFFNPRKCTWRKLGLVSRVLRVHSRSFMCFSVFNILSFFSFQMFFWLSCQYRDVLNFRFIHTFSWLVVSFFRIRKQLLFY